MKRLSVQLLACVLIWPVASVAQTVMKGPSSIGGNAVLGVISPALISRRATGVDNAFWQQQTNKGVSAPSLTVRSPLPFRGGANNCGVVAFHYNSAYTVSSVTDDKSETWVAVTTVSDGSGGSMALYAVLGTTAGTSLVTVAFTGQPTAAPLYSFLGAWLQEFQNCGSLGGNGTLNTVATGSALTLTLSAAPSLGDMVLSYFWDTGNEAQPPARTTTITVGSGFSLLAKQRVFGKLAEYSTTTSSASVQVTYSGTNRILGVGIVIKRGAAGTGPPTTKYIDSIESEQVQSSDSGPTLFFPCGGNTIVLLYTSNLSTTNVTAVSGAGATWATGPLISNGGSLLAQIPYGLGATTCGPSTTLSVTLNAAPSSSIGTEFVLVSVTNAASAFDTSATTTGTQSVAANLTTVSITPAALNEVIFGIGAVGNHTVMGTAADANSHTPTPFISVDNQADNATPACTTQTPGSTLEGDNGLAFFQNAGDTTAVIFVWTGTFATGPCTTHPTGTGAWSAAAAAFK